MEAKGTRLIELIGNKDNIFSIPHYQRNYNWGPEKQVKELMKDLMDFNKLSKEKEFFLGVIIVKKNNNITSEHILVDGQQRVTTFLIFVQALKDSILVKGSFFWKLDNLLTTKNNQKFKLLKINNSEIIKQILTGDAKSLNDSDKESNYYKVYKYLSEWIKKNLHLDEDKESFYDNTLNRIQIALINLNSGEDENLIFESINSKGESLSPADLIKNHTVMKIQDDNLLKEFEDVFLKKFEDNYEKPQDELLQFYRQIIAIKTGKLESKKGKVLYLSYRKILEDYIVEGQDYLDSDYINSILNESMIYHHIFNKNFCRDLKDRNIFYPLIYSNLANFYTIIHVILWKNINIDNNKITYTDEGKESIRKGLKYLSALCVARTIVSFGRVEGNRAYSKMGYNLKSRIDDNSNLPFDDIFNDSVINHLNESTANYRMPSISDIKNIDSKKDLYSEHKLTLRWILTALEENLTGKELKNYNSIEIEHIFPQSENKQSNNNSNEMKEWLNSLGNLSILDKKDNIIASNKVFKDKKDVFEKFSYYKINKMLDKYEEWNLVNLKDRATKIIEDIDKIWFEEHYFKS